MHPSQVRLPGDEVDRQQAARDGEADPVSPEEPHRRPGGHGNPHRAGAFDPRGTGGAQVRGAAADEPEADERGGRRERRPQPEPAVSGAVEYTI